MDSNKPNPHQALLERQLPAWAQDATPEHWQRLGDAIAPAQGLPGAEADWFANAAPCLRKAVEASQARLMGSQRLLAKQLRGLKSINAFAEPLLAERLRNSHGFSAPLRKAGLVWLKHLYTFQVYVTHHQHRSLLEAALQNFSDRATFSWDSALALDDDWTVLKTTVMGKTTLGDSETEVSIALPSEQVTINPLALSPDAFARTCRELDIGQRYQDHLDTLFAPAATRRAAVSVYQDRLRLAADLARIRHRLDGPAWDAVQSLLTDGHALPCRQLSLFGVTVHEAVIIETGAPGLLLHLPGQLETLCAFDDLDALREYLRTALLDATFRQRFMDLVPSAQRALFCSRLRQNLDAQGDSPAGQAWPLRADADLHLEASPITGDLYDFLHNDHLARLKREARQVAVPTADADELAYKARKALWNSAGLNALMIAGLFVPALGSLMTAVIAYQLLDETYEGYEAWQVGDRQQAMQHLQSVAINLAVVGGLHLAGKVVKALGSSTLMENLEPVTFDDGSQRLWRPVPGRLLQDYPRLTASMIRRLQAEEQLPSQALSSVQNDSARQFLNSALEGLYLPEQASADSERLIINALPQLPGWPAQLRLELRAASPRGPVLMASGAESGSRTCVVIKSAEGYEAHLGERPVAQPRERDLGRAVLHVLSRSDHQVLGLAHNDIDSLRGAIHRLAASDNTRAMRLLEPSALGWGPRGGLSGGMEEAAPRIDIGATFRRYRQLYPEAADLQINEQLTQWVAAGLDPVQQMTNLERELMDFRDELRAWVGDNPLRHAAARKLVSNWQRISEFSEEEGHAVHLLSLSDLALTDEDLAALALPDRFEHIQRVDLTGNRDLTELPAEFLERFPRLEHLHLVDCRLAQIPDIAVPESLRRLDMQGNRIVWNDANQAALDRLSGLELLDLSHNTLARSPDLGQLDDLDILNLNHCELVDWPAGIRNDDDWQPRVFDLRDNRFANLPQDLQLSRVAAQNLWLESDDLSEQVSQQIQAYYDQHGIDLLVADADYEEMLEDTDVDDWGIWNDLPLAYRRELRGLQQLPDYSQPQLWERLRTFADPRVRDYALSIGAMRLLEDEVFPPPFEE
ncbi:leucine-rich repeat domain-containing protein [Pseudomonas entomophila]|uniref:leucine-rich repeat domain-containing protein n=1 Tax=Pseudomonas entomophila TaxID=312306 RepID=UPI001BCDE8A9|nr:leucine-rich repeat domain-containing protein [Pseudomonas entomophila]QVM89169.1 leucine-rich repeat domain-containing protein [Pseudomonas entomophila]